MERGLWQALLKGLGSWFLINNISMQNLSQEQIVKLRDKLLNECLMFSVNQLDENNEFHPFAYAIVNDHNESIAIVEQNEEDEFPSPLTVIEDLSLTINEKLLENSILGGAICVNVLVSKINSEKECIEIRIFMKNNSINYYFPYSYKNDKTILFEYYTNETNTNFPKP